VCITNVIQYSPTNSALWTKTWDGDFAWGTTKQMTEIKNLFYPRLYQSDRFIDDRKYKQMVPPIPSFNTTHSVRKTVFHNLVSIS
jgi:hypothetical protein